MKKDLITVKDLSTSEIDALFLLTDSLKRDRAAYGKALESKTIALIFQKPSNRTRVSFAVGMHQMGGHALYLAPGEINLGVRESIADVARTLSRYVDGIVVRTFAHAHAVEMAHAASVPVINGLTDFSHPCQALADIYTAREKFGNLKGLTLAYVGDGNNVCNSLLFACAKMGLAMHVATPEGYEPDAQVVKDAQALARTNGASVTLFHSPEEAVAGAEVIYTDVWTSMGQEAEVATRKKIFKDFQVNASLVARAKKNVLVMHCLPAHRGEEITDEVIEGKNSVVFDEAENRMHVQKAVLIQLLQGKKGN